MEHREREDRVMKEATKLGWRVIAELDDGGDPKKTVYQLQTPDTDFDHEPCGETVFSDPGDPLGYVTRGLSLDELETIVRRRKETPPGRS